MKYYTEDHQWVEIQGDEAVIGISEYAVEQLGEITMVELPEEDDDFIIGDRLGEVEGEEENSTLYAPISGTISAINEILTDDASLLNESPEEKGWLCKMCDFDEDDLEDLMDEDAYNRYISKL